MGKKLDLSSGFKFCNGCKLDLKLEKFGTRGTGKIFSRCKICCASETKSWITTNPEKYKEMIETFKINNPLASSIYSKNYRVNSPEKEKLRTKRANRRFLELHPDKSNAKSAYRRGTKLRATPSWINHKYVGMFYTMSKEDSLNTGIKHNVDHIVPLISDYVCGFHSEDNLQVLTFVENNKKNNVYWPNMFEITPELKKLMRDFNGTN